MRKLASFCLLLGLCAIPALAMAETYKDLSVSVKAAKAHNAPPNIPIDIFTTGVAPQAVCGSILSTDGLAPDASLIVDTDGNLYAVHGYPCAAIDTSSNENGLSAYPDKPLMLSSSLSESPNHYGYSPDSFDICASPLGVSFSVHCFRVSQYSVVHRPIVELI